MAQRATYLSFLIRIWSTERGEKLSDSNVWQCEVEHIQTGRRWSFDSIEELYNFLQLFTADPDSMLRSS